MEILRENTEILRNEIKVEKSTILIAGRALKINGKKLTKSTLDNQIHNERAFEFNSELEKEEFTGKQKLGYIKQDQFYILLFIAKDNTLCQDNSIKKYDVESSRNTIVLDKIKHDKEEEQKSLLRAEIKSMQIYI